jgi:hypothetical protein
MSKLERALEDCLARLASGQAGLEDCLALYPEQADELRRLLMAVKQLERGRSVRASAGFKARTRTQLWAYMAAHPRGRSAFGSAWAPSTPFRLILGLSVLTALFLVAGTALAQAALPGSAGYDWKIASEHVWRVFQPDPLAADVVLANRRADELAQVADDPQAQVIALQAYRQALATLNQYTLPASRPLIREALVAQQQSLNQAGLNVPELNALLTPTTSGPAPPTATLASPIATPALPASTLVPPTPTLALPAEATLIPLPEVTLALPLSTVPPVLLTSGAVASTAPGVYVPTLALPLPLPTL